VITLNISSVPALRERSFQPFLAMPSGGPTYVPQYGAADLATYARMWCAQPEAGAAASYVARSCARVGIHVLRRTKDNDQERLLNHPVTALLRSPNPRAGR
jgi:hypothetical protein